MKGAGQKTQTTSIDPQTQKMRQEVFDRARMVSNQPYTAYQGEGVAGMTPSSTSAMSGLTELMPQYGNIRDFLSGNLAGGRPDTQPYDRAGSVSADALRGDPHAIAQLMNPYTQNVINATHGQFDKLRDQAALGANDAATRAGAFGGDRAALMKGARLGEIDSAEGSNIANLLQGGYSDIMNRALQGAGLGLQGQDLLSRYNLGAGGLRLGQGQAMTDAANSQLGALQSKFNMGDVQRQIQQARDDYSRGQFGEQRDWGLRGLNILQGGMSGMPYGQTSSEPLQRNAFAGALGGAMTGAQLGSVIPGLGTAAGGIVGGLGGLLFG